MNPWDETLMLDGTIQALKMKLKFQLLKSKDFHPGQLMILSNMMLLGSCTQRALAKKMNCSPASIGASVKRLEKAGLIKKLTSNDDLRCTRVELTEKGEGIAKKSKDFIDEMAVQMLKDFSNDEIKELNGYLQRIKDNLESYQKSLTGKGGITI